jgi:hypothetical protein
MHSLSEIEIPSNELLVRFYKCMRKSGYDWTKKTYSIDDQTITHLNNLPSSNTVQELRQHERIYSDIVIENFKQAIHQFKLSALLTNAGICVFNHIKIYVSFCFNTQNTDIILRIHNKSAYKILLFCHIFVLREILLTFKPSNLPLIIQPKQQKSLISISTTKTKQASILDTKYNLDFKQESKKENIFKNMFKSMFSVQSLRLSKLSIQSQLQTPTTDFITRTIQKQDVSSIVDIVSITKPKTVTKQDFNIKTIPIIPTTPETSIISSFDFIGGAGNKPKNKKKKQGYNLFSEIYSPSVEAFQLNIKGKQQKTFGIKELGFLPKLR